MPKIKPETKVLIIKNLKSKSPAEVADIFNVSKRQVERIRKHYQETGDVHDRPRSTGTVGLLEQNCVWSISPPPHTANRSLLGITNVSTVPGLIIKAEGKQ
ncbi:hypothetical protein AAFF_G00182660 [Aldrovandia affinis]|uniref:Uncharacterized protein n=1 Tax=Aldrovandia affinis TaxID=143900 RepID=A0AAD7RK11_9TELE|nr:hypothetical protein AAFF_G00182660 [Aldrovandia affinis]